MKLVIPASLKLKGLGITGEEKSWVDLCKSLDIDYKGQSAHRLIKTKYPEVHDAICKDCIYDKNPKAAKAVKPKPVKAEKAKTVAKLKQIKAAKPKVEVRVACDGCGVSMPRDSMSILSTPSFIGKAYRLCPNCVYNALA